MADTYTTNLNLTKPEPGAAEDTWGISLNADLDSLDAIFGSGGTAVSMGAVTLDGLTVNSDTILLDSGSSAFMKIDRGSNSTFGIARYYTAGVEDWRLGTINDSTSNFYLQDASSIKRFQVATNGDISFYEDTGTTQALFWDASAERLGLGTTSPSEKLTVAGIVKSNGLSTNTAGVSNFIAGVNAGSSIISGGEYNTLIGDEAGASITTGDFNVAVGTFSLDANTTAGENTAIGYASLSNNITGTRNVASGFRALQLNTAANDNTATGYFSLYSTTGSNNTAIGKDAGKNITTGSKNTIIGSFDGNEGGLDIRTANNHIVLSDGDGNPRQVIDSSGKVGIGTTSPNAKLTVQNGIQRINSTDGSSDARIQFSMTDGSDIPTAWAGIPSWNKDAFYIFAPTATGNESAAFYTNANWVFQTGGTEALRIDSSQRVGIGTTSPSQKLHVYNAGNAGALIEGTNVTFLKFSDPNTNAHIGTYNNGTLRFGAENNAQTNHLVINSSGNIGIGTDSPDALLHLSANTGATLRLESTDTAVAANEVMGAIEWEGNDATTGSSGIAGKIDVITEDATPEYSMRFFTQDNLSGTYELAERMRIKSDGKVGIGTSSPSSYNSRGRNLVVNSASGNSGISIVASDTTSSSSVMFADGTGGTAGYRGSLEYNHTSDALLIGTAGTERMRIDSSGNVGIGDTTPDAKLTVQGDVLARDKFRGEVVNYAANQDAPYLIAGTSGYTGATTNWNTYGFQHRIKTDSGGAPRVTIDTYLGEAFTVTNNNRVGIGTDTPSSTLEVNAPASNGIRISSTAPYLFFNDTDTAHSYDGSISQSGTTLYVGGATPAQGIVFRNKASFGESARLDTSGNLLVGTTSTAPYASTSSTAQGIAIRGDFGLIGASRPNNYSLALNRAGTDGAIVNFRKDGTTVGNIGCPDGANGSQLVIAAGAGGSNTGVGLRFTSFTVHNIIPCYDDGSSADNHIDLGNAGARFDDIYATNGTIQTSDRNEKQDIQALTDAEQRVATACKGLIRRFRWQDAVEEKGDDARYHFGVIAQDLQDAFTAEGLDAGNYGMFISSTWEDDDGVEQTRLGVRYNELLAFIIAAI